MPCRQHIGPGAFATQVWPTSLIKFGPPGCLIFCLIFAEVRHNEREVRLLFRIEDEAPEAHPAGAARRIVISAGTARSAQGRACFWRGVANPCARAPFWHFHTFSTGGSGGMGDPSCWWARSRFSGFLPPFRRSPEAERFRARFDNVRAVRNPVQQRLAQSRIRKYLRPFRKG